ncbi:erg26, C-3 sterol dehydrogenase [Coniosporium apollinis]|uniref:Erg26, C-3 sterol dehydrogenase n=1 Tax=Coniosporium apollinis TaxID=61459 RepID=A0ABQ9P3Y8_9PEZI|nr:erg26, C-3 sterol dehydrogenase [Coniosporium apollinis]
MSDLAFSNDSLGHVLITGGCGFLGHHIVNILLERHPSTRITVLDLRTNVNRNLSPQVTYYDGDLTDSDFVNELFERLRPDVVIHTASPHAFAAREVLWKVNVEGTKVLLEAAQKSGVKAFVHTSSASVIMDRSMKIINADERWPVVMGKEQPEYYTTTKAHAELAVLAANRTPPTFLTTALRPAGIFGEGDGQTLPGMLNVLAQGKHTFQIGANDNLFDFTYVLNVAHAHILAANALLATASMAPTVPLDNERVDGEAFFITNDAPIYFWDFARTVWFYAGDRTPLSKVWVLPEEVMSTLGGVMEWVYGAVGKKPAMTRAQARYACMTRYFDISKAKRRLGYSPIVGLEEGIRRGVEAAMEERRGEEEKKGQ